MQTKHLERTLYVIELSFRPKNKKINHGLEALYINHGYIEDEDEDDVDQDNRWRWYSVPQYFYDDTWEAAYAMAQAIPAPDSMLKGTYPAIRVVRFKAENHIEIEHPKYQTPTYKVGDLVKFTDAYIDNDPVNLAWLTGKMFRVVETKDLPPNTAYLRQFCTIKMEGSEEYGGISLGNYDGVEMWRHDWKRDHGSIYNSAVLEFTPEPKRKRPR